MAGLVAPAALPPSAALTAVWRLRGQGMMIAEMYIDHLARALGKPVAELQALNFYREGQATHFGQPLVGCQVRPQAEACVKVTGLMQVHPFACMSREAAGDSSVR